MATEDSKSDEESTSGGFRRLFGGGPSPEEYKRSVWRFYAGCAITYSGSPQGAAEIADRMLEYELGRFGEPPSDDDDE